MSISEKKKRFQDQIDKLQNSKFQDDPLSYNILVNQDAGQKQVTNSKPKPSWIEQKGQIQEIHEFQNILKLPIGQQDQSDKPPMTDKGRATIGDKPTLEKSHTFRSQKTFEPAGQIQDMRQDQSIASSIRNEATFRDPSQERPAQVKKSSLENVSVGSSRNDLRKKKIQALDFQVQQKEQPVQVRLNKNLIVNDKEQNNKTSQIKKQHPNTIQIDGLNTIVSFNGDKTRSDPRSASMQQKLAQVGPSKLLVDQKQKASIRTFTTLNYQSNKDKVKDQGLHSSIKSLSGFKNRNEAQDFDDSQSQSSSNQSDTQEPGEKSKKTIQSDQSQDSPHGSQQDNDLQTPNLEQKKQFIFQKIADANQQNMEIAMIKRRISKKLRGSKSNKSFKNHQSLFDNLTEVTDIATKHAVISVIITYDSSRVISVVKMSDRKYAIQQFDLKTQDYVMVREDIIGGQPKSYIKAKEVEQNSSGSLFSLVYLDSGKFKLRIFDKSKRTPKQISESEIDINKALKIDDRTVPIDNLDEPYISSAFLNSNLIFVALFHNKSMTHYHFMYNIQLRQILKVRQRIMEFKPLNFPTKVFYSDEKNQVFVFYRQGQAFSVNVKNLCCQEPSYKRRNSLKNLIEQQDLDFTKNAKKCQDSATYQLTSLAGSDIEEEIISNIEDHGNTENIYYKFEKITDRELGQMYLVYNKALVVRTSDSIMFFRQIYDNEKRSYFWKSYHQLNLQGTIYFIKGNQRIQITTLEKIYVYVIDYETLEPTLENVMFNLMECDQMIFGSKRRFCITFKKNQPNFVVRTRKYNNDFRIKIDDNSHSFESPIGLSISSAEVFIVSEGNSILVYDSNKFQKILTKKLEPHSHVTQYDMKEPNQILSMAIDEFECFLAVLVGKQLQMREQRPLQLYVYKINVMRESNAEPLFTLHKYLDVGDLESFQKAISTQFYFKIGGNKDKQDTLLFAQQNRIFSLNFETGATDTLCSFENELKKSPEFFLPNDTQTSLVIASEQEGLFVNIDSGQFIDLDEKFSVCNIKQIIYDIDDQAFYILANLFKSEFGLYLIRFDEQNPNEYTFLIKIKNKLDIGDASISVMRDFDNQYKELVVSFKQININTFNMIIIDISQLSSQQIHRVIFKTQTFQLWESKIKGFLIHQTKDFVTVSNDGIHVIALGQIQKRTFRANKVMNQLHSLEFVNFLKIDPNNCISFDMKGDSTIIHIENQYMKQVGKELQTLYDTIMKIKIHTITLRELILIESINNCRTEGDIQDLLRNQPNASMFYKSFLELNGTNMVSILAFDSRSMKVLLDEKTNKDYFQEEFPIFYRNKCQKSNSPKKYFYQSAIDVAYKHNQIRAIEFIIDYIIKYQNKYTSAFLFFKMITKLMQKGINLSRLFGSDIFSFKIKYEEWPSIHWDNQEIIMPYNGSIFEIRQSYELVFGQDDIAREQKRMNSLDISKIQGNIEDLVMGGSENQDKKVYKTIYTVNLLPMSSMYAQLQEADKIVEIEESQSGNSKSEIQFEFKQEKQNLVAMLAKTDNISVFEQTSILELLDFKWNHYGQNWHIIGFVMHFVYMVTITYFVMKLYLHDEEQWKNWCLSILMLGIAYPFCYDSYQLYTLGRRQYFQSFWNYIDFSFIWVGMINILFQISHDKFSLINKVFQVIVILLAIFKTFYFVRIFKNFSGIVIMLFNVVIELRIFLLFYFFIVYLFGLIFMVIGAGNEKIPGKLKDELEESLTSGEEFEAPNPEYKIIGHFWGNMLYVFRTSVGDFDFEASSYLTSGENWLFFVCWTVVTILSMIVFLNFIISEIGGIYNKYYEKLDKLIQQEKANLIEESESMMPTRFKNDKWFPKIIIKRSIHHNS